MSSSKPAYDRPPSSPGLAVKEEQVGYSFSNAFTRDDGTPLLFPAAAVEA
jgi:hypothetical protein